MQKKTLGSITLGLTILLAAQSTWADGTPLGFGNEKCQTWVVAQNGGDSADRKFAMEEWYLGYLNAFSALRGITFDGMPPDVAINMMTSACKAMPGETVSTVANAAVNILEKRARQ